MYLHIINLIEFRKRVIMENIIITADSTCDLSHEILEKYKNISIVPLYVNMDDKFYKDGVDITISDLFEYVDKTGKLPKTSAVSISDYTAVFKELTNKGYSVIHINIGSHFSCCHQNALIAAEEFENVYVVDSANLSTGMGHLVIKGAELALKGMPAKDIYDELLNLVPRIESSFVLDSLDYLKMGGRCSSITAIGANILGIKPCIEVREGKMHVGKKYRGKIKDRLSDYIKDRLSGRDDISYDRIFITHTSTNEIMEHAKNEVCKYSDFKEILTTTAGSTIASHCGPHTLGILFIRK